MLEHHLYLHNEQPEATVLDQNKNHKEAVSSPCVPGNSGKRWNMRVENVLVKIIFCKNTLSGSKTRLYETLTSERDKIRLLQKKVSVRNTEIQ